MLFNVDTREGNFNLRGMAKTAGFDVEKLARAVNDKHLLHKLRIDIRDGLKLGIMARRVFDRWQGVCGVCPGRDF